MQNFHWKINFLWFLSTISGFQFPFLVLITCPQVYPNLWFDYFLNSFWYNAGKSQGINKQKLVSVDT